MWVYRNRVVHDRTIDGVAHAAELQTTADIYAQFAVGTYDLPASERHYIESHTVDSLLRAHLTDRQRWLAHVILARQVGQQQRLAGIQGMQAGLHAYLHPEPAPP